MAVTATSHLALLEREADIYVVCERAAGLAKSVGFDRYACADIETAVSEICSNAIRHAEGGWVAVRVLGSRFEVEATDHGPGFDAPRRVAPGLGIGLEGARRLMGELTITHLANGTRVTMSRPLPGIGHSDLPSSPWSVSAAFRTKGAEIVSGDSMRWVEHEDGSVRVVLADGLGSGPHAADASRQAVESMARAPSTDLRRALVTADSDTRSTRGCAVAAVNVGADGKGVHSAIGDVTCQITTASEPFLSDPGVVGMGVYETNETAFDLPEGAAVLLWTDGLQSPDKERRRLLQAQGEDLGWIEEAVLQLGSPIDDGSLVVLRRRR